MNLKEGEGNPTNLKRIALGLEGRRLLLCGALVFEERQATRGWPGGEAFVQDWNGRA